jgi:hypothetical protein
MALVGKVKLPLTAGGLGAAEINMDQAPSSIAGGLVDSNNA